MADATTIEQYLVHMQVRYRRRAAMRRIFAAVLVGATLALVWTVAVKALELPQDWNAALIKPGIVLFWLIIGVALTPLGSLPSTYALAKRLDDHFGWGDQLSTAYGLRKHAGDPMLSLVVDQVAQAYSQAPLSRALPTTRATALVVSAVLLTVSLVLPTMFYKVEKLEVIEDLGDMLKLPADLSEEEKGHFARIQKMINQLQLGDSRISRKEMLARFSREIEGIEELEDSSEALKRALEQLKEAKEAIAGQALVRRQIEEIEEQHTDLEVVDQQTGETIKAETIQAMVVQEARRKMQQALAQDMKQVALEEGAKDGAASAQWQIEESEQPGAGSEGGPERKQKVVVSYEDLVKAAEKTDIRKKIFTAAADATRSELDYREVYDNYHRAFEYLLYQGNLSLGTRQYLRRYFRAIQPQASQSGSEDSGGGA